MVGCPFPLARGSSWSLTDTVGLVGKHHSRAHRCRPGLDSYARRPMRLHNEGCRTAPVNTTDLYHDRLEQLMADDRARLHVRQLPSHLRLGTVKAELGGSDRLLSFLMILKDLKAEYASPSSQSSCHFFNGGRQGGWYAPRLSRCK